jgi:hypothetical protein
MLEAFEFGHEIHGFVIGGKNILITDGRIRHGAQGGGRQNLLLVLFDRAGFGLGHRRSPQHRAAERVSGTKMGTLQSSRTQFF